MSESTSNRYLSQKDPKWASEKLGTCKDTLAQSACYITSGCNLAKLLGTRDTTPSKLNKYLTQNAGYSNGCLLITPKMASYLGLIYKGKVQYSNTRYCIAETDHYRKYGVPQHFFVYDNATKKRIDPLDLFPVWEPNDYHIVSYRLFDTVVQSDKVVETVSTTGIPVQPTEVTSTTNIPVSVVSESPEVVPIVLNRPEIDASDAIWPEPSPTAHQVKLGFLAHFIESLFKWLFTRK